MVVAGVALVMATLILMLLPGLLSFSEEIWEGGSGDLNENGEAQAPEAVHAKAWCRHVYERWHHVRCRHVTGLGEDSPSEPVPSGDELRRAAELVRCLADDEIDVREAAESAWMAMGDVASVLARAHLVSCRDPEVRARLQELLKRR